MTRVIFRSMSGVVVFAFLLGSWGCTDTSNEEGLTATSGPGSAPPGARANSEELPPPSPAK